VEPLSKSIGRARIVRAKPPEVKSFLALEFLTVGLLNKVNIIYVVK